MRRLTVRTVPLFSDNFAYILETSTGGLLVVDPADPRPVLAAIGDRALDAVLTTHKHEDHTAGNAAVHAAHPRCAVVGPRAEAADIPALTLAVDGGDVLTTLVGGAHVAVLATGCHTRGHVAYVVRAKEASAEEAAEEATEEVAPAHLFCGDTLFVSGCGRFFEGGGADMLAALDAFASLPDDTLVWCGHEYTEANCRFAAALEPESARAAERLAWAEGCAERGEHSVPVTLGAERELNPFMRVREASVAAAVAAFDNGVEADVARDDPAAVMSALRRHKDRF
jgi:hydroxyacylglutathione hydrolase